MVWIVHGLYKLRPKYPREIASFLAMHGRVKTGKVVSCFWPRSGGGFFAFLDYVGPVPSTMKDPTIGRSNHSKGYEPGNCSWQERAENTAEMWERNRVTLSKKISRGLTGKKFPNKKRRGPPSETTRKKLSLAQLGKTLDINTKNKIARSVKLSWQKRKGLI